MASETIDPIDWLHPHPTQGSTPWAPRFAHCNAGWAANHKTCCSEWAAIVRPSEYQTNTLPVRPLKVTSPIDWSHPSQSWAVPSERLVHSINRCSSSTSGIRPCNLQHARQPPCLCGHSVACPIENAVSYPVARAVNYPVAIAGTFNWLEQAVNFQWFRAGS